MLQYTVGISKGVRHNGTQSVITYTGNLDLAGRNRIRCIATSYCPFCDVAHFKNIMETRGHMIWLENAYPVLRDSWQTLIIESDDCDGEFCEYTPDYATQLIAFGLEKWQQVKDVKRFRSVVFYRNHGYMSSGTIHHPHSDSRLKNYTIITTISSSITCRGRPSSKRTASKSISRPVPLSVSMKSTSFSEIRKNFRNSSGICSLSPTISFTILCGATKAIIFFSTISPVTASSSSKSFPVSDPIAVRKFI